MLFELVSQFDNYCQHYLTHFDKNSLQFGLNVARLQSVTKTLIGATIVLFFSTFLPGPEAGLLRGCFWAACDPQAAI